MSTDTPQSTAAPFRRQTWHRSLWIRILGVLFLIWGIGLLACWWPSRSAWAVFGVNGLVETPPGTLQNRLRNGSGWSNYVSRFLAMDTEVTSAWLLGTGVDDQWLAPLSRFRKLERITLDGGQVGPGLQHLANLPNLTEIHVIGKQMRKKNGRIDHIDSTISGRHFLSVPQLKSLMLAGFNGGISDLYQLQSHPNLKTVSLQSISGLGEVLKQLEGCQNIESLSISPTNNQDAFPLESLGRMSHLKFLEIFGYKQDADLDTRLKSLLPTTRIGWR
ncbi:MAG: hypothetical protein JSS49_06560 [Planctomycetes bacterium]|nr:hypothetical protein [Planctomycetota bacterium]